MARRALALAGNPKSVLDLPCGAGRFWELLAENPERELYAADNSENMVAVADLTRRGFINGDVSVVMSPRTVLTWAENAEIFGDLGMAFRMTFLNKCDEVERGIVAEFYQRCFGKDLPESTVNIALN